MTTMLQELCFVPLNRPASRVDDVSVLVGLLGKVALEC
jgi:hypothetical protein